MITLILFSIFLSSITDAKGGSGSCCVLTPQTSLKENTTLQEKFRRYGIVGEYLSKPPKHQLVAKLPPDANGDCEQNNSSVIDIQPGDSLSPLKSFKYPIFEYPNGVEGTLYALFLVDIDIPSRKNPTGRAYIHGIYLNCPADDLLDGDVVAPYVPATPGIGSGPHRYVGLVYKQRQNINTDTPELWRLARERMGFSVEVFAKLHNLQGPEAGSFSFGEINACAIYDN